MRSAMNQICSLLNPDNTMTVNRLLAHAVGMPAAVIYTALIGKYKFIFSKKIAVQKNDGTLFPVHRKYLIGSTDLEIVTIYNAELMGICNYYCLAVNFSKLNYFAYLMEYSCLKTIASRHKSSISKFIGKYRCGKKWGVPYETKSGAKIRFFADYSKCKAYC